MHRRSVRRAAFRRTRRVGIGVGVAVLLTFTATGLGRAAPGAGTGDFNAGRGNASAFGITLNPVVGGLSFGITAGLSIAGHQNTGAQGQSQSLDMGVIGVTLGRPGCLNSPPTWPEENQPQPALARTGDEGAAEGFHDDSEFLVHKFARATDAPYSEGITTIQPFGDPALVHIGHGRVIASSGVVEDGVRQALAITEIDALTVAGGLVELRGMRWEARHRSGAEDVTEGAFSIEGLFVAGERIPLPEAPDEQIRAVDEALRQIGLTVRMPQSRVAQNIVFVDPLKIGIVPSDLKDDTVNPVFSTVQDRREQIFDLLIDLDCGELGQFIRQTTGRGLPNETMISVFDILLGSTFGGGSNTLELGGVQATTAEITGFQFPDLPALAAATPAPELPEAPSPVAGGPPPAAAPAPAVPSATAEVPAAEPAPQQEAAEAPAATPIQPIADVSGSRGGWMALVGGLGLGLLAACAEADRRKMRKALLTVEAPG